MKKLCVFCGSGTGLNKVYAYEAQMLGKLMAEEGIELIYGGGSIGLMGILADSVLEHGGKVTGVIPKFLKEKEVGHDGLSEMIVVETMHQRKMKMADLAEGFVALPGGIGTLEEMFEIYTWVQLNLIHHPVAVLNVNGYYDKLLEFLDNMVKEGLFNKTVRNTLIVEQFSKNLIYSMKYFSKPLVKDSIEKT